MHYYFKDKLSLFETVFARRASVTVQRRTDALNRYEAEAAGKPTVEGALRAFLDTDFDLYISGGEGWVNYAAFVAQVSNTPEIGAQLMDRHFDSVVLRLIEILDKALAPYPKEDIFWGYDFVTGALMHALARTARIDKLSGGICTSEDFAAVKERMATFMAGGFMALRERHKEKAPKAGRRAKQAAVRR
jgi:AcrR family transcriptional regulator